MNATKLIPAVLVLMQAVSSVYAASFDVRAYGAKGDRKTNDQKAIQAALDACAKAGGGTVYFPAGDYLSGSLRIPSRITLHIDSGATLYVSTDAKDYKTTGRGQLLVAQKAEHIAIVGAGCIHGQGTADYGRGKGQKEPPAFRTGILLFEDCRNILIRDITILYSDSWTLHFRRCDNVTVDGVTIRNNYYRANSDGIDPNSCRNVRISNCHIVAGDDCIVLKATEPYPCENVVVTNCTLETIATALKLGTESRGDFRNIHFSNCTIRNSPVGIGFYMKDGATMERVTFSNISIESSTPTLHSVYPIFMDIEKRHKDSKIGRIRDITFRDIQIASGYGSLLQGMPESPLENLTLDSITIRVDQAYDQSRRNKHVGGNRTYKDERDTLYTRRPSYLTLAHVRGLWMNNIRVAVAPEAFAKFERSAVSLHEISDATVRGVFRSPAGAGRSLPVIALENCRDTVVAECFAPAGTPALAGLRGPRTANVRLRNNLLGDGVRETSATADAAKSMVKN
ncbi:MAG: glycosyl hydrolase family 28 protein [Candidatus Sumerlaeia bacterium]|nr:glycosyl hydrolase family 28 protein [Candidatus Sumerlaeia bacterium]